MPEVNIYLKASKKAAAQAEKLSNGHVDLHAGEAALKYAQAAEILFNLFVKSKDEPLFVGE